MTEKPVHGKMLINEQYLTVKKIGQGGFGVVWRAYDFSLKNYVAVKELLQEYSEAKYVEMFYKEALIAKNIIHDNIVRVQHFWKGSNGAFYITMDYVSGTDLENLLKLCNKVEVRLPWELVVLIAGSALKALDYANRIAKDVITGKPYGIVYRDISPGNILISFEGNVKLSDFGVAKTAEEMADAAKKRIVAGKYAYMSPEQMRGEPDVDHRSDVFSIGVVLFEMLAGRPLYSGDTTQIREQVLNEKFDPNLLTSIGIPDDLAIIVQKALEKDKELRYEKAIEMFRDLRRLLKGKETEELAQDLSVFIARNMNEEISKENEFAESIRQLNLTEIKGDPKVTKITCKDFIVGDLTADVPHEEAPPAPQYQPSGPAPSQPLQPPPPEEPKAQQEQPVPEDKEKSAEPYYPEPIGEQPQAAAPSEPQKAKSVHKPEPEPEPKYEPPPQPQQPQQAAAPIQQYYPAKQSQQPSYDTYYPSHPSPSEEKGKTVFEEVGDWLVNKFKVYKKRLIRVTMALIFFAILFTVADTFLRITPVGSRIYSMLYPPDVVITTVPPGATVTVKTRDGKPVISNADSSRPIELRKVLPRTYVLTAMKDGFKTVERIIKIEEQTGGKKMQQNIEVTFDFALEIDSMPPGAEVYVDGNKFNVTPCRGEFVAGEHTIKLAMKGFEDLGSTAKEAKAGQCNIDFTRPSPDEAFGGIDPKYWKYDVINTESGAVFKVTGHLYKFYNLGSVPKDCVVHIEGESQPRGNTPLRTPLKAGTYKIRFLDSSGKYQQTTRPVTCDQNSNQNISVYLNKWVTFKVRSKEHPNESFVTNLKIKGAGMSVSKEISTNKPIRMALPVTTYEVIFEGDKEYKTLALKVNIAGRSLILGELEYENSILTVNVKDESTKKAIEDAYVWLGSKIAGKTNSQGAFETEVLHGTTSVRIVAKGYIDKTVEKAIKVRKEQVDIELAPERVEIPGISTAPPVAPTGYGLPGQKTIFSPVPASEKPSYEAQTPGRRPRTPGGSQPDSYQQPQAQPQYQQPQYQPPAPVPRQPATSPGGQQVIVCPNCGKEYVITGPKKPRFCTNCGRPFNLR
ncbi:MAG: protein kinase [Endomicrobiales bacterium]|nr:protein kinase [Endomicrobiales bacterium]